MSCPNAECRKIFAALANIIENHSHVGLTEDTFDIVRTSHAQASLEAEFETLSIKCKDAKWKAYKPKQRRTVK